VGVFRNISYGYYSSYLYYLRFKEGIDEELLTEKEMGRKKSKKI